MIFPPEPNYCQEAASVARPHLDLSRFSVLRSHLDAADEVLADMRDVPIEVLTAMTTAQMFCREGFRQAWDALDEREDDRG